MLLLLLGMGSAFCPVEVLLFFPGFISTARLFPGVVLDSFSSKDSLFSEHSKFLTENIRSSLTDFCQNLSV